MKGDRVGEYFKPILQEYVFDNFTDSFLEKLNVKDFMTEVPIPICVKDFEEFTRGGVKTIEIVRAVSVVLGCDTEFQYRENYIQFLDTIFKGRSEEVLVNEGYSVMAAGDNLRAAAYFRATLAQNPNSLEAIYGYALACRALYTAGAGGDENYVGRFKAESIEAFELLNEVYPDFPFAYYYLGYIYLNMGLYIKTQLAWKTFLEKLEKAPDKDIAVAEKTEIEERMATLEEPVIIEKAINAISSGKYSEGINSLEKYLDGAYKDWWPMHYYLGIAYECTGFTEEAIREFKRVLTIYPSHIDSMDELVAIYNVIGDTEKAQKYIQKIQIVKAAAEEDAKMADDF